MLRFAPHHAPQLLRLALYGLACAVLAYLCLAPARALPPERLWDKAEHGLAWAVLAGLGLLLWPGRARIVAAFALAFGGLIEVLQAILPLGRDGDVRDLVADALGVGLALLAWAAARRAARP